MNVTLIMLRIEREQALERAHGLFIEEPTLERAWQLAAATEMLLNVLKEL